jgi:transaldolase/glucose-6-phosphate isomerase
MIRTANLPDRYGEFLSRMEREWILSRIWAHDFTVWKPNPTEITNRLGWLHAPFSMMRAVDRITAFANDVRASGFKHVVLLGMGGSSLAPETFARTFGAAPGWPNLSILDSTHPVAIAETERQLDLSHTLFVVATKSGTTTETLSLFRYFHNRALEKKQAQPGAQFVAITDPGSPLVELAAHHGFRKTFLNDPDIGGRYAALSLFGLVPAALLGIDISRFLTRSQKTSIECAKYARLTENPAVRLGAILAACAIAGRDKLTFVLPPEIVSFGDWVEQLIAESTGKEGTGILPIVGEPIGPPGIYSDDRLFVSFSLRGNRSAADVTAGLERLGHPVIYIEMDEIYSLGGQFFLWELATALAASVLGINPFDQPNVDSAKRLALEQIAAFRQTGELPASESSPLTSSTLTEFLSPSQPGDYIALQAYLPPGDHLNEVFASLRAVLRDRFGVATTFGYGPRFLHSTGQLHKGDRGNGRFIQFVAVPGDDLRIPDEPGASVSSLTFGALISAQARGDRQALLDAGRSVATFTVPVDPTELIHQTAGSIAAEGGRSWTSAS